MDRCPTEMWHQIFAHACTDNGFTGRSLSLTSRYFRETSKPVKLQSLSVTQPEQIHALDRLVAVTPPKYCQIRYLFIASPKLIEERPRASLSEHVNFMERQGIREAILRIIKAVAPTLVTLSVHFPFTTIPLFLTTIFPSLLELTFYGYSPMPSGEGTVKSPDHPPLFPSLCRLRLTDSHSAYNLPEWFSCIAGNAPALTHLCLPDHPHMSESLLTALGTQSVTHKPASLSDSYGVTAGLLPSTIEMILIKSGQGRNDLCDVVKKDKRVHWLEEQSKTGIEDAERYWLDRIEGGEALWVGVGK